MRVVSTRTASLSSTRSTHLPPPPAPSCGATSAATGAAGAGSPLAGRWTVTAVPSASAGRHPGVQLDLLAQRPLQELLGVGDHRAEVEHLRIARAPAAEQQQPPGELVRRPRCGEDLLDVVGRARARLHLAA